MQHRNMTACGSRPEADKVARVIKTLAASGSVTPIAVITGQLSALDPILVPEKTHKTMEHAASRLRGGSSADLALRAVASTLWQRTEAEDKDWHRT